MLERYRLLLGLFAVSLCLLKLLHWHGWYYGPLPVVLDYVIFAALMAAGTNAILRSLIEEIRKKDR